MTVFLCVATIPQNDPTLDPVSNNFVFQSVGSGSPADAGGITTHVANFYNVAGTGGSNAIANYLGDTLDTATNHASCTFYDITAHLDGTPHGGPVALTNWTLTAGANLNPMPEGVTAVISYRGNYGTLDEFLPAERPRARMRGRIYVGPLSPEPLQRVGAGHRTAVKPTAITDFLAAAFNLSETVTVGGNQYNWRQWSRKNAAVNLITELWMDDRPDYQRRRTDPDPGSRTYLPASSA